MIFTTSWKNYDLEIVNIISGKLMYMGYGDGKFKNIQCRQVNFICLRYSVLASES